MGETLRYRLPLLAAAQAQKEVTHNEALLAIDRIMQLAVQSRAANVPPASPQPGSNYIVADGGSGAWAGQSGRIASYDGYGWTFTEPLPGCLAWVVDEGVFAVFASGWSSGGWPVVALNIAGRRVLGAAPVSISAPAGGINVDAEARTAIAALATALRAQGIVL